MRHETIIIPAYVVKAAELPALHCLSPGFPRPVAVEWINRGTDQRLRPSSVEMLLRTLFDDHGSPSVVRLHQSTGLRFLFEHLRDRDAFASSVSEARALESVRACNLVCRIFGGIEDASAAAADLAGAGVSADSISMVYRPVNETDFGSLHRAGHSKTSVAAAVAGGGFAGAILGVVALSIPGIGPVVAAGPLAAAAFNCMAGLSAAIGATGGAIARMLSDEDVDGREATGFEQQVRWGKVLVSVDLRKLGNKNEVVERVLRRHAATSAARLFNANACAFEGHESPRAGLSSDGKIPGTLARWAPAKSALACELP